MKQFVVRGMVTLGLVTSLGLGVSAVASAGGTPSRGTTTASSFRTYQKQLATYRANRNAIEATFRSSIQAAHSIYQQALSTATTSAQRSAAEQTEVTAVINAASARSSALVALGNAPTPPSN
jgi:hypothetical protein